MDELLTIVGFRYVNFKDDSGKLVQGYTLYYTQDSTDENTEGLICGKQFISATRVDYDPVIGDKVVFRYNKYGKIAAVEVV